VFINIQILAYLLHINIRISVSYISVSDIVLLDTGSRRTSLLWFMYNISNKLVDLICLIGLDLYTTG